MVKPLEEDSIDINPDIEDPEVEENLIEASLITADEMDTSFNVEIESSCHECMRKDKKIENLSAEVEKLRRELTGHRREREKQRTKLSEMKAGCSFFREDQLKYLKKKEFERLHLEQRDPEGCLEDTLLRYC